MMLGFMQSLASGSELTATTDFMHDLVWDISQCKTATSATTGLL